MEANDQGRDETAAGDDGVDEVPAVFRYSYSIPDLIGE